MKDSINFNDILNLNMDIIENQSKLLRIDFGKLKNKNFINEDYVKVFVFINPKNKDKFISSSTSKSGPQCIWFLLYCRPY